MLEYLLLKYYSINLFQYDPGNQIIGCEESHRINLHDFSIRKKVVQWEAPECMSSIKIYPTEKHFVFMALLNHP